MPDNIFIFCLINLRVVIERAKLPLTGFLELASFLTLSRLCFLVSFRDLGLATVKLLLVRVFRGLVEFCLDLLAIISSQLNRSSSFLVIWQSDHLAADEC